MLHIVGCCQLSAQIQDQPNKINDFIAVLIVIFCYNNLLSDFLYQESILKGVYHVLFERKGVPLRHWVNVLAKMLVHFFVSGRKTLNLHDKI